MMSSTRLVSEGTGEPWKKASEQHTEAQCWAQGATSPERVEGIEGEQQVAAATHGSLHFFTQDTVKRAESARGHSLIRQTRLSTL